MYPYPLVAAQGLSLQIFALAQVISSAAQITNAPHHMVVGLASKLLRALARLTLDIALDQLTFNVVSLVHQLHPITELMYLRQFLHPLFLASKVMVLVHLQFQEATNQLERSTRMSVPI